MLTHLTSLAKPLLERAARCVGAVMVWRKDRAGRAARARLQKKNIYQMPQILRLFLFRDTNLYILKFSLVPESTAESEISIN